MKLTLKQINEIVKGSVFGNEEAVIEGVNSLEEAGKGELSFLGNKKYAHFMKDTKAEAVLFPANMPYEEYKNKNLILVDNPQLAFAKILTLLDNERLAAIKPGISTKASIAEDAVLGKGITIGHNVVIEERSNIGDNTKILANSYIGNDVSIGKNCLIYPNVTIREKTKIGDNCIIHPGVVIGGDGFGFVNTGKEIYKIPQIGHVEIGNNVEIGANTTVDRAAIGKTFIGDNTKIDNLVMVAHNCEIGENTVIAAQTGISGSVKVGKSCMMGGQVGIAGHITIADKTMIGAQAGVISTIKDEGRSIIGSPAIDARDYMKAYAIFKNLHKQR